MCGIAGFWSPSQGPPVTMTRMLAQLHHRGPDDQGMWFRPGTPVLGQCRLSILDLSANGHQPMEAEDGQFAITFNGEIYNFQDIRSELEVLGHTFYSHTDTEVVLRGYQEWGTGILQRLVGMFAFGIWDGRKRELFVARDRAGEKPLYYASHQQRFAFASELSALRQVEWIDHSIDKEAVALYLNYQYVPAPWSIYKGVRKLPPAHALRISADGKQTLWRYWDPQNIAVETNVGEDEALENLEHLLARSVRGQLISDVPLGAFLSGGVDSSLVVAMMREQTDLVRTFTIGFDVPEFNEADHAAAVAEVLGTEHTTEYLTEKDALALVPQVARMYGEPFADSSALPTHLVSVVARRHVTVSLSGDGGDEVFGGYTRYDLLEKYAGAARALGGAGPLLKPLLRQIPGLPRRAADFIGLPEREVYRGMVSVFSADQVRELTDHDPPLPLFDQAWSRSYLSPRRRAMLADLLTYMPEAILVKVDRAAMATSLETRAPFLDHRVMEYALRLPTPLVRGKPLLKKLLYRRVPQDLVDRPKKGFGVPLAKWLRHELRNLLQDTLTPATLTKVGIVRPDLVSTLLEQHLAGRADHSAKLWALFVLCQWAEATE